MGWLLGLVAFGTVSSITPGPNNVLLWASGARFGVRRTLPHVLGTAAGIGAMALLAAAGLTALLSAVPQLAIAMKLAGSLYLVWLAWRIARSGGLDSATAARPLSVAQAAAFQAVNPKAWIFALGAVSTFRPSDLGPILGTVIVAAVMIVTIIPCAWLWSAAGGAMAGLMDGERTARLVKVVLATLVVVSIAIVWI
jgi:threonine/homoserine/homoserine lactone efflux protein